jgi:phytoene dehydrogenase-like protein
MYGLIVIGDDLSSHVAAAVASSKGIKTALIAECGIGGVSFCGDLAFDTDPTPLTGFGENQICFSLLQDLDFLGEFNLLNPAYQIILPGNRIDFFNDKEELVKELAREFPELAPDIKSFYDAAVIISAAAEKWLREHPFIQPKSFKDYMEYIKITPYLIKSIYYNRKLSGLMKQNASFQKVVEAGRVLLSFKTNNQSSFFSHFQHCTPLRGAYNFSQGRQTFFDSLIKKIELSGGIYLNNCEVLAITKGKIIEVTYMNKNGAASKVEADNLIVSTKWQNMRLLLEKKKFLNFGDFIRPAKISHYPFTIHLGINPQCLPEKMAGHVAVISDINKDIYDNNLIILDSGASQNESPASKIPLSATVYLPDNQEVWAKDSLKQTADSIIERLENFLPFLKENIEFFDIEESINISRKQRSVVNPKYQIRNSFCSGFAAKNNKTKFGNIYLTGGSLLADAGIEGEVISGINAVSCLTSKGSKP